MKKPDKKDFTTPFIFDDKFCKFDAKAYAKALEKYIDFLETKIKKLQRQKL